MKYILCYPEIEPAALERPHNNDIAKMSKFSGIIYRIRNNLDTKSKKLI